VAALAHILFGREANMSEFEQREQTLAVPNFVPLEREARSHVDTRCAAYHLGRKPQTLRVWASTEQGPLQPIRIRGRLAWPVSAIRRLLASN
jgi:hypothetical protein